MSRFIIPKGKEYTFNVTVFEVDSYIAQDLTNVDPAGIKFVLFRLDDNATQYSTEVAGTVIDAPNGKIEFTLSSVYTSGLEYERGPKIDGYYLKPTYQGVVVVEFTDSTPDRVAPIEKIYVSPTGA